MPSPTACPNRQRQTLMPSHRILASSPTTRPVSDDPLTPYVAACEECTGSKDVSQTKPADAGNNPQSQNVHPGAHVSHAVQNRKMVSMARSAMLEYIQDGVLKPLHPRR